MAKERSRPRAEASLTRCRVAEASVEAGEGNGAWEAARLGCGCPGWGRAGRGARPGLEPLPVAWEVRASCLLRWARGPAKGQKVFEVGTEVEGMCF